MLINHIKLEKNFLIILFILSFALRAVFFTSLVSKDKNYFTADSQPYHDVAVQIANGNGITNLDGSPHFYRLPGYSIFLALFYKIFNFDMQKTLWVQLVLASFIPVLIFLLSTVLFAGNIAVAKLSAVFAAAHLGFVLFSGFLMTETLFIIFLLLFYVFFFLHRHVCSYFVAGIFLGVASMFRPIGVYTVVLSIGILLFSNPAHPEEARSAVSKGKNGTSLFLGWLSIVFWWLLRSYLLTGFVFFHTLPGKHFLNHTASYVVMKSENISYNQAKKKLADEFNEQKKEQEFVSGKSASQIEQCVIAEKLAFKYIKNHLLLAARFSINNVLKTAFTPFSEELFFIEEKANNGGCINIFQRIKNFLSKGLRNKWLMIVVVFDCVLFLVMWLGFFGFFLFFHKALLTTNLLSTLLFITMFIGITLASGFARLRIPAEPLLIILSMAFWVRLFQERGK